MITKRIRTVFLCSMTIFFMSFNAYGQAQESANAPAPSADIPPAACSCGTVDFHSGQDWSAKEGSMIPAADDGVVVAIEEDEKDFADRSAPGYCGRYVVVMHSYPNGRVAYTRYAQLGKIVDKQGNKIRVGDRIKRDEKIAEVGSSGIFHFEVRPVEKASTSQAVPQDVAKQGVEWEKIETVNPSEFDFEAFAGKAKATK